MSNILSIIEKQYIAKKIKNITIDDVDNEMNFT